MNHRVTALVAHLRRLNGDKRELPLTKADIDAIVNRTFESRRTPRERPRPGKKKLRGRKGREFRERLRFWLRHGSRRSGFDLYAMDRKLTPVLSMFQAKKYRFLK